MFKRILASLFLCLALACPATAATVTWCITNFVQGVSVNRATVISQVANQIGSDGHYLIVGTPMRFPATNQCWSAALNYGVYRLDVEGLGYPKPLIFQVPNDNGTYTVTALASLVATNLAFYLPIYNGQGTNLTIMGLHAHDDGSGSPTSAPPFTIVGNGFTTPLGITMSGSGAFGIPMLVTTGAVDAVGGLIAGNNGVLANGPVVSGIGIFHNSHDLENLDLHNTTGSDLHTPSILDGAAVGDSGNVVLVAGDGSSNANDTALQLQVSITPGGSGNLLCTVTFGTAFDRAPVITYSPLGQASSGYTTWLDNVTANGFEFHGAPTIGNYKYDFHCYR